MGIGSDIRRWLRPSENGVPSNVALKDAWLSRHICPIVSRILWFPGTVEVIESIHGGLIAVDHESEIWMLGNATSTFGSGFPSKTMGCPEEASRRAWVYPQRASIVQE